MSCVDHYFANCTDFREPNHEEQPIDLKRPPNKAPAPPIPVTQRPAVIQHAKTNVQIHTAIQGPETARNTTTSSSHVATSVAVKPNSTFKFTPVVWKSSGGS